MTITIMTRSLPTPSPVATIGNFWPYAALLLLGAACQTSDPLEPIVAFDTCPPEACGLNGPRLADSILGELDLDGTPGPRGFAMVDFLAADGDSLALDITDAALIGRDRVTGATALAEERLLGSEMILQRQAEDGALAEWRVRIDEVHTLARISAQAGAIPAYRLSYRAPGSERPFEPLCPDAASAVIITGERYDSATLAIAPLSVDERHFRLACAGDALAKARLMSYDPTLPPEHPYHTTRAQRRATLAMLTADYCGTGWRFARPGTSLYWRNRADWMVTGRPDGHSTVVEAVWDEHGAVCLDSARPGTSAARAEIAAVCGRDIPRCNSELIERGEWITWLPRAVR